MNTFMIGQPVRTPKGVGEVMRVDGLNGSEVWVRHTDGLECWFAPENVWLLTEPASASMSHFLIKKETQCSTMPASGKDAACTPSGIGDYSIKVDSVPLAVDTSYYPLVLNGDGFSVKFKQKPDCAIEVTGNKPTYEQFLNCLTYAEGFFTLLSIQVFYIATCHAFDVRDAAKGVEK